VKWENIHKTKEDGSLGVKDLELFKIVLLVKDLELFKIALLLKDLELFKIACQRVFGSIVT